LLSKKGKAQGQGTGPRPLASVMKNIFGLEAQEKMPSGFCDSRVLASKGPGSRGADQRSFDSKPKSDAKIHRAASRGDVEEVKALLSSGRWAVDARDKQYR
jgi:hypothetical protein